MHQEAQAETLPAYDNEKAAPRTGSVDASQAEILRNLERMNEAIDGENEEHADGFLAALKAHPWACLWAFIMCFTIVSLNSSMHWEPPRKNDC